MNKEELNEFKERAKQNGFFTNSQNSEFYTRMFNIMDKLEDANVIGQISISLVSLMEKEFALKERAMNSIDNVVNGIGTCFITCKKPTEEIVEK